MAIWDIKGKIKKKDELDIPPPIDLPQQTENNISVERILDMRGKKKMSDNQIVQTLQREGYSPSQIFDVMNQADLNSKIPESPYPAEQVEYPQEKIENQEEISQYPQEFPEYQDSYQEPYESKEKIEELVEVIIEEKWNEFIKDINKIIEWKKNVERKINDIDQKINDLHTHLNSFKKNVLSKINEYDTSLSNVGTSVKAMETAFTKILPTFTENVNELNKITKKIKK